MSSNAPPSSGFRRRASRTHAWLAAGSVALGAWSCDSAPASSSALYVADADGGLASIEVLRATQGHQLRAEAFTLSYVAQGLRPRCGCVEVDPRSLTGAPTGLLEEAAVPGTQSHEGDEGDEGEHEVARICAKNFTGPDEHGRWQGAGYFELSERAVPVALSVELTAKGELAQGIDVRLELPLVELGLDAELLDREMVEATALLEFHGESRLARAVDARAVTRICAAKP